MNNKEIKKELKENQITVFVVPNTKYATTLNELAKEVSTNYKKIAYISLNKPYNTLIKTLSKDGLNPTDFFVIDAVTHRVIPSAQSTAKCYYISGPSALTELGVAIGKLLAREKIDAVIFDSLSTLLVYQKGMSVIKFTHFVMSKIRTLEAKGVFTALKEDIDSGLIKDLNMFADKIVEVDGSETKESKGGKKWTQK